jgi:hypothetical protein
MQQRDPACERLLRRGRAGNREVHGPQLLRGQIFVVMAFVGQSENSKQRDHSEHQGSVFHGKLHRKRV